ncbi:MAG: sulfatase-like hydrolase/transferase [Promethearchaeota archaeon]
MKKDNKPIKVLETKSRPNIIIIMADEFRGDLITSQSSSILKLPNINRIRKDGVTFTNNFAVNPVCTPSRCCIFTGQYVHNGGHRSLYHLLQPYEENLFKFLKERGYEVVWIGRNDLFSNKAAKISVNKRIGIIGIVVKKILRNLSLKRFFKLIGFGLGYIFSKNKKKYLNKIFEVLSIYLKMNPYPLDHKLRNSFYFGKRTKLQAKFDFDAIITEKVLKFIKKRKIKIKTSPLNDVNKSAGKNKKPFCLYIAFNQPHPPYTIEEPYFSMYDRQNLGKIIPPLDIFKDKPKFMKAIYQKYGLDKLNHEDFQNIRATYYGMVSYLDSLIGRIIDKLIECNLYDNSAIFFLSDHGDFTGDYGLVEKWPSALYDCLLKVPLVIKLQKNYNINLNFKGNNKKNQISGDEIYKNIDKLTQSIDIFPTILELARIEVKYTHFGKSLLPIIKGESEEHRDAVFAEGGYNIREPQCFERHIGDIDNNFTGIYWNKVDLQQSNPHLVCRSSMVRTEDWKLIIRNNNISNNTSIEAINELYYLKEDPYELKNLFYNKDYKLIIENLREKLLHWYLNTSDNPSWRIERKV